MTLRLYYDDSYMKTFSAKVLEVSKTDGGYIVTLDRSAFYPTSGGQPFDTGTLGQANVIDVYVDETGEVRHVTDACLQLGSTVTGNIDWPRRFDHMQQHAGEHMIAGAIYNILKGNTIGLHLGADFSTIDVELPNGEMRVPWEAIDKIETTVNEWIQRDLPIKCFFPTPDELSQEPLRKPPTVKEHIRLVKIGDVECVACGGTHPNSTGQVGLVKIIDVRPSKGKMRVSFVCGMRAFLDYRAKFNYSSQAARLLSTSVEALPERIEKTLERLRDAEKELNEAKAGANKQALESLIDGAVISADGIGVVAGVLAGFDQDSLCEAAKVITKERGLYAVLANYHADGANVVIARPETSAKDMGGIFAKRLRPLSAKGGGGKDFARGAGNGDMCVAAGLEELRS